MSTSKGGLVHSTKVTADDHGAHVTIAALWMATCTLFFFAFRLWTRRPLRRLFRADDAATVIATVLSMGQSSLIIRSVAAGLGKRAALIPDHKLNAVYLTMYAADILYIATLAFGKLGTALLVARLTQTEAHIKAARVVSYLTLLWAIACTILVAAPCATGKKPWAPDARCEAMLNRWTGIATTDVILEAILPFLAVYLVWGIQVKFSVKIRVFLAFATRIPVPVMAIVRLVALRRSLLSPDPTFDLVMAEVYEQIQMHLCVIAATAACITPFMRSFHTGYLTAVVTQLPPSTAASKESRAKENMRPLSARDPNPLPDQAEDLREIQEAAEEASRMAASALAECRKADGINVVARSRNPSGSGNNADTGKAESFTTDASDTMLIRIPFDYKAEKT